MKAPEKELKNVFVMKLNAESIRIYKKTLPSWKSIVAESFKVAWRTWHRTNYIIPVLFCFFRFLWIFMSESRMAMNLAMLVDEVSKATWII